MMKTGKDAEANAASAIPQPKIWIDASGFVRWGAQPVTGVQRVELGILSLVRKDESIGIVVHDNITGFFEPASPKLLRYIDHIIDFQNKPAPDGYFQRVRGLSSFLLIQFLYSDNETARRFAQILTSSNKRSGLIYQFTKYILRIFIYLIKYTAYIFFIFQNYLRIGLNKSAALSVDGRSVLLVSHQVNRRSTIKSAIVSSNCMAVHIVYDLIPVLQPQLTHTRFASGMDGFFRRILKDSEFIIAISESTRRDLLRWGNAQVANDYPYEIKVCRLGCSIDRSAQGSPIGELIGKKFSVFCSTIDIRKNHFLLVKAWRIMSSTFGSDVIPDLLLIGRPGSGWDALQEEVLASRGIADKIHVRVGASDAELVWAYRNAELGLFPSAAEGWGLGVSESLAHGLPVVHSDIPILHEAAQGLMPSAPVGDVEAWAKLLGDLFANSEKIEALREVVRRDYEPGPPDGFARCVTSHLRMIAEHGTGFLELKNTAHF